MSEAKLCIDKQRKVLLEAKCESESDSESSGELSDSDLAETHSTLKSPVYQIKGLSKIVVNRSQNHLIEGKDKLEFKDNISMFTQTDSDNDKLKNKVDVGTDAEGGGLPYSDKDTQISVLQQEVKDLKKKNETLQNLLSKVLGDYEQIKDQWKKDLQVAEEYTENMAYQSNMLLTLINDLMDLAKLDTLNFKFNDQYFDLPELINQTFKTVKSQASKKEISLLYNYSVEPLSEDSLVSQVTLSQSQIQKLLKNIYGDRCRYQQILLNFLSNAIKFTNKGKSIQVRVILKDIQLINEFEEDPYQINSGSIPDETI